MNIDLFELIIKDERMHPAFKALKNSSIHVGARNLMSELYSRMGDSDGNFVKDFQSDGFHSRMFEIACYAYLESQSLTIENRLNRPDFIVSNNQNKVAIEAVTSNPATGRQSDISLRALEPLTIAELIDKCNNEFPIKIGSILQSKLKKEYWLLPQCKDIPFILLVGPFHEAGSVFYTDESLARYLYGIDVYPDWIEHNGLLVRAVKIKEHQYNNKVIPSNFFAQPSSDNISAIIYNNSLTVPKFLRIAAQMGSKSNLNGIRQGTCLLPEENGEYSLAKFRYNIYDSSAPLETWWQSATIFHNPNAKIPISNDFFACTSSYKYSAGYLTREVFDFHPLESFTHLSKK